MLGGYVCRGVGVWGQIGPSSTEKLQEATRYHRSQDCVLISTQAMGDS